jgi:hypothetical protein
MADKKISDLTLKTPVADTDFVAIKKKRGFLGTRFNWTGKKHSEETKRKMSLSAKGKKKSPFSKEWRENLSKARMGNKNNLGHKASEETRKKMSESHKKNPVKYWLGKGGEGHPTWRGGLSFEPYGLEFNKDLKEVIRNRDRRKCQICEKTELENKAKLSVHHIDYDKKNNNPNNLISLCISCHQQTNYNRKHWIKLFNKK